MKRISVLGIMRKLLFVHDIMQYIMHMYISKPTVKVTSVMYISGLKEKNSVANRYLHMIYIFIYDSQDIHIDIQCYHFDMLGKANSIST